MLQIATITAKQFTIGLTKVLRAKGTNSVLPILDHVHLKTMGGAIVLTCTNLDTYITTGVFADVQKIDEVILIPPQAYQIIPHLLPEAVIKISKDADNMIVFSYDENKIEFEATQDENYPAMPAFDGKLSFEFEMEASVLSSLFGIAKKFAIDDDLKPALQGVFFSHENIVGTNAFRLISIDLKQKTDEQFGIILRKSNVDALASLDPEKKNIKIKSDYNYISFTDKSTKVLSRLIDAKYPAYKAVMPTDHTIELEFDRDQLLANIKLANHIIGKTKDKRLTIFVTDNNYLMCGNDVDLKQNISLKGDCRWKLNLGQQGAAIELNFNLTFFMEMISLLEAEKIVLELNSATKAAVIRETSYYFLLMPLAPREEKK